MSKNKIKSEKNKAAATAVISSLVYIVLGVVMILSPAKTSTALCYILGAAMTVYGLFNIITFFANKESSFGFELIIGIIAVAFGIFFLISPQSILGMLAVIIGILIIVDSAIDIKRAVQLKALGARYWWISMILSIAVIIFGAVTIIFPTFFQSVIMIVLGITLVYEGFSALILIITIGRYSKKLKKSDMIEIEVTDND